MRYYVTSDIHSYFTLFKEALTKQGFFEDEEPHKLVICGDLFDRGFEALELQNFIVDLMEKDQVILIRGNHEDLMLDLIRDWKQKSYLFYHHGRNGTVDTALRLTGITRENFFYEPDKVLEHLLKSSFITQILPAMQNYFETDHYIFTHGWIPCLSVQNAAGKNYMPIHDWRTISKEYWDNSRWINGMEAAHDGILEKNKTIVCGHWHCSFGHSRYENDGEEFGETSNFNPYYAEGIIAIDGCTAYSGQVNCIIIED